MSALIAIVIGLIAMVLLFKLALGVMASQSAWRSASACISWRRSWWGGRNE